jgi:phenylacetate-coenzyme A ligase PaaK-like adenylate-forming protein
MTTPTSPAPLPEESFIGLVRDLLCRSWRTVETDHFLDDYQRSQWLAPQALRERQLALLRRLAWHCFLSVPFYSRRIAAALPPSAIERLDDIAQLPLYPASARRSEPAAFIARTHPGVTPQQHISGTRGTPEPVYADGESLARRRAVRLRSELWAGARPRGPDTGSAGLSPAQRLQARLSPWYLAAEVGVIAATCERGGLHVHADHLILEVVDDAGRSQPAGTAGRLLVTDLFNHAAPYLRHDLGDLGRLAPAACCCGRSLPLLDVLGRAP